MSSGIGDMVRLRSISPPPLRARVPLLYRGRILLDGYLSRLAICAASWRSADLEPLRVRAYLLCIVGIFTAPPFSCSSPGTPQTGRSSPGETSIYDARWRCFKDHARIGKKIFFVGMDLDVRARARASTCVFLAHPHSQRAKPEGRASDLRSSARSQRGFCAHEPEVR